MILDMLKGDRRVKPERVLIDHVEEHTVRLALDNGFWCAMTLYPTTKCTPARAADIIERYGDERIMVNSAGDWGPSNPLAVPDFIQEMRKRGHSEAKIRKIVYENPLQFYKQCRRFKFTPPALREIRFSKSETDSACGFARQGQRTSVPANFGPYNYA